MAKFSVSLKISVFVLSLIGVAFFMSSCSNQMITVGGWIPTADKAGYKVGYNPKIAINNMSGKANFGGPVDLCNACEFYDWFPWFHCDFDKVNSNVTFHDGDVRLKLYKVLEVFDCTGEWAGLVEPCQKCAYLASQQHNCKYFDTGDGPLFVAAAKIVYSSQNPKYKDKKNELQYGYICTTDNGEGYNGGQAELPDFLGLILEKGVFKDYKNCGPVQGNIQQDACYDDIL